MNGERTLEYLEKINIRNAAWLSYIMHRSAEVSLTISKLRIFATRKPGIICDIVTAKADALQERLNRVLSQ